jgi:hypothetical protein
VFLTRPSAYMKSLSSTVRGGPRRHGSALSSLRKESSDFLTSILRSFDRDTLHRMRSYRSDACDDHGWSSPTWRTTAKIPWPSIRLLPCPPRDGCGFDQAATGRFSRQRLRGFDLRGKTLELSARAVGSCHSHRTWFRMRCLTTPPHPFHSELLDFHYVSFDELMKRTSSHYTCRLRPRPAI